MITLFLKLEWLKLYRSSSFGRSLIKGLLMTFLAILLLGYLAILGIYLSDIIVSVFGRKEQIPVVNRYLFYFFALEFFYRYFVQRLPVMEIEKYLHLPIAKSRIIHFLLLRSLVSPLSLIAVLVFLPFAMSEVSANYGSIAGWRWVLCIVLSSWALHWLMLWFKQRFEDSLWGILVILTVSVIGAGAEYFALFNLGDLFEPIFAYSLQSSLPVFAMGIFVAACYRLSYTYYLKNAYAEHRDDETNRLWSEGSLDIFSRFGLAGEFADTEWKLIVRHKKSRSYLALTLFFMLYGIIFYNNPRYVGEDEINGFILLPATLMTSIFMVNYGQMLISWNSSHFDFFLSKPSGIAALIKGKFLLFILSGLITFLLTIPYVYFGWQILLAHFVMLLFNLGINLHILSLMALWNPKPMDINKGAMFNYEGVGIAQLLMVVPFLLAPYIIYIPVNLWLGSYWGMAAVGIFGLAGLLLFPRLAKMSVDKCIKNKYRIAAVFRSKQA